MGLILDSSIAIAAERRGDTVEKLLEHVISVVGDQVAALTSVCLTELIHGVYRAREPDIRVSRSLFIDELIEFLDVYPYTKETAILAGRIDGEQRTRGVTIPFADLLIGATALSTGFAVLTVNLRHFSLIPKLDLIQL